ncbi:hypothetical protein VTK26DRAFT_3966 [Humicola hyalothermophila]
MHYHLALCLLSVLTAFLALWAVLYAWTLDVLPASIHNNRATPDSPPVNTNCGSSPSEARRRGCRFDILSFAWQTPECYDAELMEEFIGYDNWTFYTHPFSSTSTSGTDGGISDSNSGNPPSTTDAEFGTDTVDISTALEGERTLYVDWKYHVVHCTFMWRQMHRAYTVRGYIDSHLDDYRHTLHCQLTLLDRETPLGSVVVVAELKYPDCRKI